MKYIATSLSQVKSRLIAVMVAIGGSVPSYAQAKSATLERHWYGLVGPLTVVCFIGWLVHWVLKKHTLVEEKPELVPRSFAELPKKRSLEYEKELIVKVLLGLAGVMTGLLLTKYNEASLWFPHSLITLTPLLFSLPSLAMLLRVQHRRSKQGPDMDPKVAATRRQLVLSLSVSLVSLAICQIGWLAHDSPGEWLGAATFCAALGPFLLFPLLSGSGPKIEKLGPGDPDYEAAMELSRLSNVRVRYVKVLSNWSTVNAFATPYRTIWLTQGTRLKLNPSEKRSIIAHEIDHLRSRVNFVLLAILAWWIAWEGLYQWLKHLPYMQEHDLYLHLIDSPIFFYLALSAAVSPLKRLEEYHADKFALRLVGSFDELALTLAKIHLRGERSPSMSKVQEAVSSHPSLLNRLRSLEKAAKQLGIPVAANAPEKVIENIVLYPLGEGIPTKEDLLAKGSKFIEQFEAKEDGLSVEEKLLWARALGNGGVECAENGRPSLAIDMQRIALRIREKYLGDDDHLTLVSKHNLALAYKDSGKFDKAERVSLQVLEARIKVNGRRHESTMNSINQLGRIYLRMNRLNDALAKFLESYELRSEFLGPAHLSTIVSMTDLGTSYLSLKQYDKAEVCLLNAADNSLKLSEKGYRNAISSLSGLATLYSKQGKVESALVHGQRAFNLAVQHLGREHASTLNAANNLALVYVRAGETSTGEELLRNEILAATRARVSGPKVTLLKKNLLTIVGKKGSKEEADALRKEIADEEGSA